MAQVQDPKTDGCKEEVMNSAEQNGGASGGVAATSSFVFGQNMESRVVKRPADEQLNPDAAVTDEEKTEDAGEFTKATPGVLAQRPIITPVSAFKDKPMQTDESESAEKPAFKLAPATFGATRTTRTDEKVTTAETKVQDSPPKDVVKPAVLAPSQEWQPTFTAAKTSSSPFKLKESALQAVTEHMNGKGRSKDDDSKLGNESDKTENCDITDTSPSKKEGASSDGSTRSNYFLKLNPTDDRNTGFGVFGTFSDSQLGKVSFENNKGSDGNTTENYFLQFANNNTDGSQAATSTTQVTSPSQKSGGGSPSSLSLSGSGSAFVFGHNMNERVSSVNKQQGELEKAGEFVFGQNLSDRVKSDGEESKSPEPKAGGLFSTDASAKTLAENAAVLAEAKENSRLKFEQVPKLTGEEEEENVLQVQCKLYIFDVQKSTWQERGRGMLRLNDKRQSPTESAIQSRIVMRTQGSLRVILNTKLWSSMILEKASSKSLRISALDSETKTPKVFLISSTPKDAEQMYRAIEYRIQELKHMEQSTPKDAEQMYRAIEYRIQELKHMEQVQSESGTPTAASPASTQEAEDDSEDKSQDATDQLHSNTSEEKEESRETKEEEVTSSTKTEEAGTLQSTETKDSDDSKSADTEEKDEKGTT